MPRTSKLPPFSALRGFEAAARLQSFRLAANELCLSPSAISHHVRQLEDFVGTPLFDRNPKGVILTRIGKNYLADLAPIFSSLEKATDKAMQIQHRQKITLRSSPSFSSRWLMPRLGRIKACVPEVDLTLTTNEIESSDTDVEFRCAFTYPLENDDEILLSTVRAPVCSPEYLKINGTLKSPEELKNHIILREHQHDSWDQWFSIANPGQTLSATELWFDDGYAAMDAAELGLGIQLGYLELLASELTDGRLVQLFEQTVPKQTLFILRLKAGWRENESIVSIRNWLKNEIKQSEKIVNM